MALSKAKLATNNKYLAEKYEIVSIKTRRDAHMNARLDMAAKKRGISKRGYIMAALEAQLQADGIPENAQEFADAGAEN